VTTATNKRLLIFESHNDSNRCTPCSGKPDQHDTYDSHTSPCTPGVRFMQAVSVRGNLSRVINRVGQSRCSREKGLPTQSTSCRLTDPRVRTQFLSRANQWSSGESHTSINSMLLGLPGSYHRHAIGTFNTYSWGPIERSLIDTGGGYNLEGVGLPRTHSPTFLASYSQFPLVAPSGLHFNQVLTTKSKCWVFKNLWPSRGLSTTRPSTVAYIYA
jgi:hypothetical protein